jgi:3-dehydroquinate dehydratase-2
VRIEVLNGVNLDLLGRRDPGVYGSDSLQDLETRIYAWARELGLQVRCRQTNHEGEYVEFLHAALDGADALVLNPGAWTHYSWAIRDALEPFPGAVVEVHISDIESRDEWRRMSVLEGRTTRRILGEGIDGYRQALELLAQKRDE